MKIVVYCLLLSLLISRIQGERILSRTKRDLISWNRMANNAFALKRGLHEKNDRQYMLARIIQFCFRTNTCNKRIE